MPAIFRQEGNSIPYTPVVDTPAETVVVQGELVGIAKLDIPANEEGALHVVGVFEMSKATGGATAIGVGLNVFWDDGADVITTNDAAGANKLIGKTIEASVDTDETQLVRMSQ